MNNSLLLLNFIIAFIFSFFLFGEAYLISVYNIDALNFILIFFLLFSIFSINKIKYTSKTNIGFFITSIFLLTISSLFWTSFYNVSSYISIIIAFFAHSFFRESFKKIFVLIFIFNFFLSFYEYSFTSYLFDSKLVDDFGYGETIIDERFSGGLMQVFRAKGIFYGPLSLGAFVISFCFINFRSFTYISMALLICFFANHRLGILVLSILMVFNLSQIKKIKLLNIISFFIASYFIFLLIGITDNVLITIQRISNTFNILSSENTQRVQFWIAAINQFLDYNLLQLIFGDNGYFKIRFGNNPESGWLSLLVDNGILGFLFYLSSLTYILTKSFKKKSIDILIVTILIFLCMMFFTFHLSAISSFMYWFVIFELITKLNLNKSKS